MHGQDHRLETKALGLWGQQNVLETRSGTVLPLSCLCMCLICSATVVDKHTVFLTKGPLVSKETKQTKGPGPH